MNVAPIVVRKSVTPTVVPALKDEEERTMAALNRIVRACIQQVNKNRGKNNNDVAAVGSDGTKKTKQGKNKKKKIKKIKVFSLDDFFGQQQSPKNSDKKGNGSRGGGGSSKSVGCLRESGNNDNSDSHAATVLRKSKVEKQERASGRQQQQQQQQEEQQQSDEDGVSVVGPLACPSPRFQRERYNYLNKQSSRHLIEAVDAYEKLMGNFE